MIMRAGEDQDKIRIKRIEDHEGFAACEQLQKEIWGFEDISVVPNHVLVTAQRNGGLLLGAYEGERLIGFLFGFPGLENERPKHCSLMCAVLPARRFQGIGYELKRQQREHVLSQGLSLITWTFDPLVSANAYFNFAKLGVISNCYEPNFYGNMRDRINKDLPTDRLAVEWWVQSPRVRSRMEQSRKPSAEALLAGTKLVNQTERTSTGLLRNLEYSLKLKDERLLVEIPSSIQQIREKDLALALSWRQQTQKIFENYFNRGYIAAEFISKGHDGERQNFYLLERITKEELLRRI